MVIFRFYNLISRISMEWGITWSTHLFTCHCLHIYNLLLVRGSVAPRAARISSVPVDARSILGVMALGAKCGEEVLLTADGDGADAALDELVALLSRDLDAQQ